MLDILLSQPATCFFPVFVLALFFWGLWTRRDGLSARASRPCALRRASGCAAPLSNAVRSSPPVVGPIPLALRGLHASCSVDYDVKFDAVSKRIRRWNG